MTPLKVITTHPAQAPVEVLAVRQLCKVFNMGSDSAVVLRDIDFEMAAGELICVLGPSGCGKTTLLKIIAGFLPPSSGRVSVQGRQVTRPGSDRCVVFQEDALFPWLTVAENVAFGLKGLGPKAGLRAETGRYLEMVGLGPFGDYLPRQLSGGMKQRAALARVLILKPRLLLMDEPFGALDAQTREQMQHLLLRLWQELGHTILFITHDISEAILLADRILMMDRHPGRVRCVVEVPLRRPREKQSDEFHRFYRQIRSELVY